MPRLRFTILVAVLSGLFASTAQAQPRQRGSIHAGIGYLSTPNLYDENGDVIDTGVDFSALSTEFGAEVVVVHRSAYDTIVGGAVHLAHATIGGSTGAEEMTSGFTTQNLSLHSRLTNERFAVTAGVSIDIGQDPEEATPPNSDGQHALLLGASVTIPAGGTLRLTGGANAFLTLARAVEGTAAVSIDDGDVYAVYLDGQYPIGPIHLGLRVQHVTLTDITRTTDGIDEIFPDSDSYQFALVPSVTVHLPSTPLHIRLQLGARSGAVQEYADYGFALAGKNVAATRLPVALRLRFDF